MNLDLKIFLLLNDKGDIVYSVAKKTDFGTNLITGPYRFSHLARLLKKAYKSKDNAYVGFEDFDFYQPSYGVPVSFCSCPNLYKAKHTSQKSRRTGFST